MCGGALSAQGCGVDGVRDDQREDQMYVHGYVGGDAKILQEWGKERKPCECVCSGHRGESWEAVERKARWSRKNVCRAQRVHKGEP